MKSVFTILLALCSMVAMAQNKAKYDRIYLNDGREVEVKVGKVTATSVEFTYPDESAHNVEDVANIRTIVYSSGRVQQFAGGNGTATTASNNGNMDAPVSNAAIEYRTVEPNVLAILPVAFYDKRTGELMESKSKLAQSRIYDFFEDEPKKITPLSLQDSRNTNSMLRKSGIPYTDLNETPIEDLERILGAEYIVLSSVTMEMKSNATATENTVNGSQKKKDGRNVSTSSTTSTINESNTYYYNVVLEIYKGGKKIYNETRKPFLNTEDAWKDAMEYMLRRTPIYTRK